MQCTNPKWNFSQKSPKTVHFLKMSCPCQTPKKSPNGSLNLHTRILGVSSVIDCKGFELNPFVALPPSNTISSIMSEFEKISNHLPTSVVALLIDKDAEGISHLLEAILRACRIIADNFRDNDYSHDIIGTENAFGDTQLHVDMKADAIIFEVLRESGLVSMASSEENPTEVNCGGNGFSVAFDPLDGSSIVDANFSVGTIVGVWPGENLVNRTGREQSLSLVAMYGPRVTIALALNGFTTKSGEPVCIELTMHQFCWKVSRPKFDVAHAGKTFAPGNLRATSDNAGYKALVDYWIDHKYTLRYSGGLVPDVYHILVKGQGVLSNASSPSAKAKLRLLYECAPIALIIEAAGGASCVCASEASEHVLPISLLDVEISDLDKRVGVCFGSRDEVDRFRAFLFPAAAEL